MSIKVHLKDPILHTIFKHPVTLPCGHTLDVASLVWVNACPLDRKKFTHRLCPTNLIVKNIIEEKRKTESSTTAKVIHYFQGFKLRFVAKGEISALFSLQEWTKAERMYSWFYQSLSPESQESLKALKIVKGVLEWNSEDQSYVYTVADSAGKTIRRFLILEDWAQNFAGKYFDKLKSKFENNQ
ncbi:MAG: hypothetical protein KBA81_08120 [Rhabdochlamydiaceae bacterium]|nr:hypothetical protein [Rhabdochlamydiaceae bacterium]